MPTISDSPFHAGLKSTPEAARDAVRRRAELMIQLQEIVAEFVTPVDSLYLLPWVLSPLSKRRRAIDSCLIPAELNVQPEQISALDELIDHERLALLEPYFEGAYPVKQVDIFSAFHQLPHAERALIAALVNYGRYSINAQALIYSMYVRHATNHSIETLCRKIWPQIAQHAVASGWAMIVNDASHPPTDINAPHIKRANKARLITREQAFCC